MILNECFIASSYFYNSNKFENILMIDNTENFSYSHTQKHSLTKEQYSTNALKGFANKAGENCTTNASKWNLILWHLLKCVQICFVGLIVAAFLSYLFYLNHASDKSVSFYEIAIEIKLWQYCLLQSYIKRFLW